MWKEGDTGPEYSHGYFPYLHATSSRSITFHTQLNFVAPVTTKFPLLNMYCNTDS